MAMLLTYPVYMYIASYMYVRKLILGHILVWCLNSHSYNNNFVVLILVSVGYIITFNATEYEFDVNVYSPVGTVVFEALLLAEDISIFSAIHVNFSGNLNRFSPYSINGMDIGVDFNFPIETNPVLTIAIRETLDPHDTNVIYPFTIYYIAYNSSAGLEIPGSTNVNLHEIGI